MRRSLALAALFALGLCIALTPVLAQERNRNRDQDKEDFSNLTDQDFITKAATGGLAEVELARMAVDQASNAEIRKFAQRLADDHSKANKELQKLAADKNVTLPKQIDKKHQTEAARLAKLRGAEFDRAFIADQVKGHKHEVAMFEHIAKNGKDKDVKAWAEKTLPTLKEHLKLAQELSGNKAADKARER
jgi:putative membrane protein